MAQATFSWPFGPIHLEKHQGAAQDERFALIFAAPGPYFAGAQLGGPVSHRKGAGGSADQFPFYYRCR